MNDTSAGWPLTEARTGEVVVIARWKLAPGHRDEVEAALGELAAASRAEAGCRGYEPYHVGDDEIVILERYADQAAVQTHRDSDHFRRFALERIVPVLADRQVVVTTIV